MAYSRVAVLHEGMELEASIQSANHGIFISEGLTGNPGWGSLIFSAIGDLTFFSAGDEFENNLFAADQAGPSVILGGGKNQPIPFQNFIGAVLGKNLIAAIGIHFQGRGCAMVRFSCDFNAHAPISSFEGRLRLGRLAVDDQAYNSHEDNFN